MAHFQHTNRWLFNNRFVALVDYQLYSISWNNRLIRVTSLRSKFSYIFSKYSFIIWYQTHPNINRLENLFTERILMNQKYMKMCCWTIPVQIPEHIFLTLHPPGMTFSWHYFALTYLFLTILFPVIYFPDTTTSAMFSYYYGR